MRYTKAVKTLFDHVRPEQIQRPVCEEKHTGTTTVSVEDKSSATDKITVGLGKKKGSTSGILQPFCSMFIFAYTEGNAHTIETSDVNL